MVLRPAIFPVDLYMLDVIIRACVIDPGGGVGYTGQPSRTRNTDSLGDAETEGVGAHVLVEGQNSKRCTKIKSE